jgi:hypothetical protein
MQSSNIPSKIPLPFAYAAGGSYVNPIPTASQIGVVNGRASLHDGFPPLTFTPIGAGGVPPFGSDMNGILNEITAIQQWQQAGGMFFYDSAFSTIINGYPKGAILQATSASGLAYGGLWISTVENNTSNPDTGGAGWQSLAFEGLVASNLVSNTTTIAAAQAAYPIITIVGALTANGTVILPNTVGQWIINNNTTGAYTLTAKTAAGTGVTLTQNASTYVFGDGTNIYFADSAKVASFNGRTGTVTLNATDVVNALGYTPLNPNQFPVSFSGNGYQKLSSGLIFQWTYVYTTTSPQNFDFSFPISFSNGCLGGQATYSDNVGDISTPPGLINLGSTGATIYNGSGLGNVVLVFVYGF